MTDMLKSFIKLLETSIRSWLSHAPINFRVFLELQVFKNYLTFCGIGITNAQLFEISVQEYKRNQVSSCCAPPPPHPGGDLRA